MKLTEIKPVYVDEIPSDLEEGNLYISKIFYIAIHLCACGCKRKVVTDIKPRWSDGWDLIEGDGLVSMTPSIGNFKSENPYHAHYYITDNKINWC